MNILNFISRKKPDFQIVDTAVDLTRQELDKWKRARQAFQSPDFPNAYLLDKVYADAMLDAHLSAIIRNRTLRLQNKQYIVRNPKGDTDDKLTTLISHQWLNTAIQAYSEAVFFGYSLLQFEPNDKNNTLPFKLSIIPRRFVLPQKKLLLRKPTERDGYPILDYPQWLLLIQNNSEPLGIVEKAVPLTIFKRHSWSAWDKFEMVYGLPIRILKSHNLPKDTEKKLMEMLRDMGTNSYMRIPPTAELDIKQPSAISGAFEMFFRKLETANAELSKLINGQTMTVDEGGSRAQSEVHLQTEEQITQADIRNLLFWLNEYIIPLATTHGLPLTGCSIDIKNQTNLQERIKIDGEIMRSSGYKLSKQYIEQTYNVQLDELKSNIEKQTIENSAKPDYDFFQ